ncbi:hypothetical protein Vadar_016885 [Vaccinium darrowii]|uniref:Uncharacterized protein n=1 Tax=Vaccinium darrowii TaxID=229202 RepID=A0ACB7YND2_9ERIC|nr:hypothetical protein Vadar_016885 [Vaccinium darrowii]
MSFCPYFLHPWPSSLVVETSTLISEVFLHSNKVKYDMAKQAYYEDTGKYFSGMDGCWAFLEHAIKWQDITPSRRRGKNPEAPQIPDEMSFPFYPEESQIPSTYESLDAETTPSSGGTGSVSSPRKRPGGKKLAKEKKSKSKVQEVENARHINLLETLNKTVSDNQARRIQLEERRVASLERGYFRCTHQKLYNCPAKKQVQRLDNDPFTLEGSSGAGPSRGGSGGAGPSTIRFGRDFEFQLPVADLADVMFNSGSSSNNSMDLIFSSDTWKINEIHGDEKS